MDFTLHSGGLDGLATPLLAVPCFADEGARGAAFEAADARAGGRLSAIAGEEGYEGKAGKTLLVHLPDEGVRRVLVVGLGKAAELKPSALRGLAGAAVKEANARKLPRASVLLPEGHAGSARFALEGAILGGYRYDHYLTEDVEPLTCQALDLVAVEPVEGFEATARLARVTGEAVILARDLVNGPPVEVTPTRLAEVAEEIARAHGLEIQVFDKAEIQRRGMNLLMAVGVGSAQEPRFVHLTWRPPGAGKDTPQIALVGKGITFDSGGYNLKPSGSIEDMKMDMAGAAAVLGAMKAVSELAPPYVVHGLVPSAENLVNGAAYKVADIFRSLNGKTVEIMNTDAEGRLILADALAYADQLGVDRIVDLATLTGACLVALGPHTAGLFGNDDAFRDRVRAAAEAVGEDVWPLPLNAKLRSMLKTPNADLKNVGERWGGAITAALFLKEFVGERTWVHLDIAGPAWADKPDGVVPKGGTGFGVMTLLELLKGEV